MLETAEEREEEGWIVDSESYTKSCEMQVGDLKKTNTDGKKLEEAFYAVDNHTLLSSVVEGSD